MHFIVPGDCLATLRTFPAACIDAVVTDPPYGLSKEPDAAEVLTHWLAGDDYTHQGSGFMGKAWDSFVPGPSVWREVLRVLKPGGHVLSFSGTRTYDLMVLAMRLAGFEIRDQLAWMYGQGFPKSQDVGRQIDMRLCQWPGRHYDVNLPKPEKLREGDHICPAHPAGEPYRGHRTALKPAQEPIVLARKSLIGTMARNVLEHGTGALNVDGCRIEMSEEGRERARVPQPEAGNATGAVGYMGGTGRNGEIFEPPAQGRWPANVILDPEAGAVLDEQSGERKGGNFPAALTGSSMFRLDGHSQEQRSMNDTGGASRFFYCAKASKDERDAGLDDFVAAHINEDAIVGDVVWAKNPRAGPGRDGKRKNIHPTVKPIALMRYLVRLITPPGGVILDPYTGSGTTGIAAKLEGFRFVGCELCYGQPGPDGKPMPDYATIAAARIYHAQTKTPH